MSTFDHVKSILGKLDRNREAARDRRLSGQAPRPIAPAATATPLALGATPETAPKAPGSAYGRATALRLTERND